MRRALCDGRSRPADAACVPSGPLWISFHLLRAPFMKRTGTHTRSLLLSLLRPLSGGVPRRQITQNVFSSDRTARECRVDGVERQREAPRVRGECRGSRARPSPRDSSVERTEEPATRHSTLAKNWAAASLVLIYSKPASRDGDCCACPSSIAKPAVFGSF